MSPSLVHSLCSLKTSTTQVRIFMTSASTTAEEARYRGPSACRVREYRMVSTREVVWSTSTLRDMYFSWEEAMAASILDTGKTRLTIHISRGRLSETEGGFMRTHTDKKGRGASHLVLFFLLLSFLQWRNSTDVNNALVVE